MINSSGDITQISSGGLKNQFAYDAYGTRLTVKNDQNAYNNLANSDGQIVWEFDIRNPAQNRYDERGRVKSKIYANGRSLTFQYDNKDRLISVADSEGPTYRNYYDIVGRLIKQERVSATGIQTASVAYDERNRIISKTNYIGEKTMFRYELVGVGCDTQDRISEVIQADGKVTKFSYDEMGRKVKEVAPDGSATFYSYNLRGDQTAVLDAAGNLMQFEYDADGRVSKTLNQSAGWQSSITGTSKVGYMPEQTEFLYDENDRPIKVEKILNNELLMNGKLVDELKYNDFGRVKKKSSFHIRGDQVVETFDEVIYDYVPQLSPAVISKISNKYVSLEFKYETQPPYSLLSYKQTPTSLGTNIGVEAHDFKVVPAQNGPVGKLSRDNENVLSSIYDRAGRVTGITGNYSGYSNTATLSFDSIGRRTGVGHSAGLVMSYSYDDLDRVTQITSNGTPALSEAISYTIGGKIDQIVREIGTFGYGYTKRNELSSVTYSGSETLDSSYVNTSLSYDVAGNLVTYRGTSFQKFNNFITHAGTQLYFPSSDGLGRLASQPDGVNAKDFKYYPNGQLKIFRLFDNSGSLIRTVDYYYDGLGRRISKVVSAPGNNNIYITYSHLGAQNKILFGKYKSGTAVKETLYIDGAGVDDHLFEISDITGVKAYKTDHLGSVLNNNAVGGKATYGVYGENLGTPVSTASYSEAVTYGYAGREYDNETGLYYYRARYYDPNQGRFLSKDPIGLEGGSTNVYAYVGNNPISNADPMGLCCSLEDFRREASNAGEALGSAAQGAADTGHDIIADAGASFDRIVKNPDVQGAALIGGTIAFCVYTGGTGCWVGAGLGAAAGAEANRQNGGSWMAQVGASSAGGALLGETWGSGGGLGTGIALFNASVSNEGFFCCTIRRRKECNVFATVY